MEELAAVVVEASTEYVGRWNRLISTTNWEKGRIVSEWRAALQQADAPAASYADDAWSQQVGGVTPQHVGRLRRVYERFGDVHQQYPGLYWSHFQAALDWPDAEMYLEGAVQNNWSVAQMRNQRWEAMGGAPELQPQDADIVAAELDEDVSAGRQPAAGDDFRIDRRGARGGGLLGIRRVGRGAAGRRFEHVGHGLRRVFAAAAAAVRVAAAAAGGSEGSVRADEAGDSRPQGLRLDGNRPRRRAFGVGVAQAVGPGSGGVDER